MKFKLTCIALAISFSSVAQLPSQQPKNQLKAGLSGTFLGSGDLYGLSIFTEYERRLSKRFAYTARLGATSASERYIMFGGFEAYHIADAFFFDQDVKVQILRIGGFSIHPHAGLSIRYSWESFSTGGVEYNPVEKRYTSHLRPGRENDFAVGYGFGLNFMLRVSEKVSLEMLNSFDGYSDGATVVMNGFSLGYRF